ncbi:MAG: AAA family ATPase [Kiritimatiellaceae bacterium]|nr:AAA family ATPase [Kiritimatiellaceae bacterium]
MKPPRIIGIVGASGSGKTSIARELAELAGNASLMSQDNYYISLPDDVDAKNWNFDDPAVVDLEHLARDLEALKRGETVEGPHYIHATHKRTKEPIILNPAPLIIVEGLFLFTNRHLRDVFDQKIFVDLPLATCLERRIARDIVERSRTEQEIRQRWAEQVEPMYRKYVEPTRAFADILLVPAERGTPERKEQIADILECGRKPQARGRSAY